MSSATLKSGISVLTDGKTIPFEEYEKQQATVRADYADKLINAVQNEQVINVRIQRHCNKGKFYNCITLAQLEFVVHKFFREKKKQAEEHAAMCAKSVVYDGFVFARSAAELEKAESTRTLKDKLVYLQHFGFPCDGIFFSIEEKGQKILSKYDFTDAN